jgi:hypothetical protein
MRFGLAGRQIIFRQTSDSWTAAEFTIRDHRFSTSPVMPDVGASAYDFSAASGRGWLSPSSISR